MLLLHVQVFLPNPPRPSAQSTNMASVLPASAMSTCMASLTTLLSRVHAEFFLVFAVRCLVLVFFYAAGCTFFVKHFLGVVIFCSHFCFLSLLYFFSLMCSFFSLPQVAPSTNESLTAAALAAAPPHKQKNMIGERLYPLIFEGQPVLAGKITGKRERDKCLSGCRAA